jgi:uncharacterized protein (TIGR02646 family)
MIRVKRGKEPKDFKAVRTQQLQKLRVILLSRAIVAKDITGYREVAPELWRAQHEKCCYCEMDIGFSYNDVEHYRPKGRADRQPGSVDTHGYWWLAFTWNNLLFACPACNRSKKKDLFPLAANSIALLPEQRAHGKEKPLLIDPTSRKINPVEHIVHVLYGTRWVPEPRNHSVKGSWTIRVCGLGRDELHELRAKHIAKNVMPHVNALQRYLKQNNPANIEYEFQRSCALFAPELAHAALSYDALRHFIPDHLLQAAIQKTWPLPTQVGI